MDKSPTLLLFNGFTKLPKVHELYERRPLHFTREPVIPQRPQFSQIRPQQTTVSTTRGALSLTKSKQKQAISESVIKLEIIGNQNQIEVHKDIEAVIIQGNRNRVSSHRRQGQAPVIGRIVIEGHHNVIENLRVQQCIIRGQDNEVSNCHISGLVPNQDIQNLSTHQLQQNREAEKVVQRDAESTNQQEDMKSNDKIGKQMRDEDRNSNTNNFDSRENIRREQDQGQDQRGTDSHTSSFRSRPFSLSSGTSSSQSSGGVSNSLPIQNKQQGINPNSQNQIVNQPHLQEQHATSPVQIEESKSGSNRSSRGRSERRKFGFDQLLNGLSNLISHLHGVFPQNVPLGFNASGTNSNYNYSATYQETDFTQRRQQSNSHHMPRPQTRPFQNDLTDDNYDQFNSNLFSELQLEDIINSYHSYQYQQSSADQLQQQQASSMNSGFQLVNDNDSRGPASYIPDKRNLLQKQEELKTNNNTTKSLGIRHQGSFINASCAVCLESIQDGHYVKKLKCSHIYHSKCINDWLHIKLRCPLCKKCVI